MRRLLLLVVLAACGRDDRAPAAATPPVAAPDPQLEAAFTGAMTAAIAAADQARELQREAETRAQRDEVAALIAGTDALTFQVPRPFLRRVTVRGARGMSGFPRDRVADQTALWVDALDACLARVDDDDLQGNPVHPHRASIRISWSGDGESTVHAVSSLPGVGDCVRSQLVPVAGDSGAVFFAFAHVE